MARTALVALTTLLVVGCSDQSVTATNASPEALITSHDEGDLVQEGDELTFVGVVSDPDHAAAELLATWSLGGEVICDEVTPEVDGSTACVATPGPDDTTLSLAVLDPGGAAGVMSVTLEVVPTGAPAVSITAPAADGTFYSDQSITLAGTVADAEDPAPDLAVWWESDLDGTLLTDLTADDAGAIEATAVLSEGDHLLTLFARDATDKTGSDSVAITVGPPNSAPACEILAPESGTTGAEGALVTFEATASDVDQPADALAVTWTSDKDGELASGTPTTSGDITLATSTLSLATHTVSLVVTDEVGATCTDQVTYTVGSAPTISLTAPTTGDLFNEGEAITLTAQVSDTEDSATDLALSWDSSLDGTLSTQGADSTGLAQVVTTALSAGEHVLTVTATDSSGMWASTLATFTVNALPTAPTVSLSPDPATTTDTLIASASGSTDPDSSGTVSYTYTWYEAGSLSSASTGATFPDSATTRGLTYKVVVTPSDGTGDGSPGEAELTIANADPVVTTPSISPSTGVTTTTTLSCTASATDDDGDTPTLTYAWDADGSSLGVSDSVDLGSHGVAVGATITCTATATDDWTAQVSASTSVTVDNTDPTVDTVTVSEPSGGATTSATLTCAATASDVDGDTPTLSYAWDNGGSSLGTGTSVTLSTATASPGDTITCTATATDPHGGTATGSDGATVINSAPSVDSVSISPSSGVTTNTNLLCSGTASDPDDETPTLAFAWDADGTSLGTGTLLSLDPSLVSPGATVTCTATATDASGDTGSSSTSVTVDNSAPSISSVTITPSDPSATDTLTCSHSGFSDPDGDSDQSTYAWDVDGVSAGTDTTLSTTLATGDTITCTVTPFDGTDTGTALSDSVTITNTAPAVDSLTLDPTDPDTDDTLTATVTTSDAEGDSVSVTYAWFVDGVETGHTGATLDGPSWFDKDQEITVEVTPDDGQDAGSTASTSVWAVNTPPEAPTLTLSPSSPTVGTDDLVCEVDVDSADLDGDSITYAMSWTVDGVAYSSASDTGDTAGWLGAETTTWPDDTVPAEDMSAGETWECTAEPDDGDEVGATASAAVTLAGEAWSGTIEMPADGTIDGYSSGAWGSMNGDGRIATRIVLTQACNNPELAFYQHSSADSTIHGSFYVMDSAGTVLAYSDYQTMGSCNDCWHPHPGRLTVTMDAGTTYYLGFQNTGADMSGPSIYEDADARTVEIATFDDPRADQPGTSTNRGLATTSSSWQHRWRVDCE